MEKMNKNNVDVQDEGLDDIADADVLEYVMNTLEYDISSVAKRVNESEVTIQAWLDDPSKIPSKKLLYLKRLIWLKRAWDVRAERKAQGILTPRKPKIKQYEVLSNDEIRNLRLQAGMTQKEFAEIIGASTPSVCVWEKGMVTPRPNQMKKLFEFRDEMLAKEEANAFGKGNQSFASRIPSELSVKVEPLDVSGIIFHNDGSISFYDNSKQKAFRIQPNTRLLKLLAKHAEED
jgi:DNA-binding transcriptional regulator YiaG